MLQFDFKDKVVVITGAAQGIGKCIKEMFEKGWIPGDDMSKNLMKQKGMALLS